MNITSLDYYDDTSVIFAKYGRIVVCYTNGWVSIASPIPIPTTFKPKKNQYFLAQWQPNYHGSLHVTDSKIEVHEAGTTSSSLVIFSTSWVSAE